MTIALNTAATGMQAQQMNIDIVANNIANVNTTAFKQQCVGFQDLLYINRLVPGLQYSGGTSPTGMQIGVGVKPSSTYRINEQGALKHTNHPLDLAIKGSGYFQVELPDGTTVYTRDGSFKKNSEGKIATEDGYVLAPEITIPENAESISINNNGEVQIQVTGQAESQTIGQITLATFINESGLQALGGNLFQVTSSSGDPIINNPSTDGAGEIKQWYLESSNVDAITEITNLIKAQRAYEVNSRVIRIASELQKQLNSINE